MNLYINGQHIYDTWMNSEVGVRISDCTKDPLSCPVVAHVIELDIVAEMVEEFDDSAAAYRPVFSDFVMACAKGNCPGQDPELTREILRRRVEGTE